MKASAAEASVCRVLSLDGGGAKGFYTLGVLSELEAMSGKPLCDTFDLIFGTSTGAIIGALLALGRKVSDVHNLYRTHVPTVMKAWTKRGKSLALTSLAEEIFGEATFDAFKTNVGIIATRWDFERPLIFKSSVAQAHGRQSSFVPGFGCRIATAVVASCSAYPFFERPTITTPGGARIEALDGGYCANNPTLYAIADAHIALNYQLAELRVLSLGVGSYPEKKRRLHFSQRAKKFKLVQLLQKTLDINTASMDQLRAILFKDVSTIRVSDTFERPEMATDLMEHDLEKLNLLYQRGAESFAKREADIRSLLAIPAPISH
jgi:patatin-like phospholipase/acyl hydrolase